jgi:hypothetical protein
MSTARKKEEDEEIYVPTPEEAAMLEESIAQLDRGESFDWDEIRDRERNGRTTVARYADSINHRLRSTG